MVHVIMITTVERIVTAMYFTNTTMEHVSPITSAPKTHAGARATVKPFSSVEQLRIRAIVILVLPFQPEPAWTRTNAGMIRVMMARRVSTHQDHTTVLVANNKVVDHTKKTVF